MATFSKFVARKEYTCSKCGATIQKGKTYYRIEERFRAPRFRCKNCRPERSELTNSEFYSWLYDLQDHLEERFDLSTPDGKDDLISEVSSMRDEMETRRDSMPEQLQEVGSGEILSSRIEALETCESDLDNVEFPDEEDYHDAKEAIVGIAVFEDNQVKFIKPELYAQCLEDLDGEVEDSLEQGEVAARILAEFELSDDFTLADTDGEFVVHKIRKLDTTEWLYAVVATIDVFDEESYESDVSDAVTEIADIINSIECE